MSCTIDKPMSAEPVSWRSSLGEVWRLAWPAMVHQSLLSSVFVVDRALVGHHSASALAAMHSATTLTYALATVLGAPAVAALAVVGRAFGAGDAPRAARHARAALRGAAIGATVVAAVVLLLSRHICAWLFPASGAAVAAEAGAYLDIVLPALPLGVVATTAAACLHGTCDTRTPLLAALLGNGANVVLSSLLVFGGAGLPALGIRGAAIGTAAAFTLQALLLLGALLSRRSPLPLRSGPATPFRDLWPLVLPALVERGAYQGAYLAYAAILATLGPTAMAAQQALLAAEALSFTIAEGFGVAAAALAAHHLGAGRLARADRATTTAVTMAATALGVVGTAIMAFRGPLCVTLCPDATVAETAAVVVPLVACMQPLIAVAVVMCAALRGAGHMRLTLWITLGSTGVLRLAAAWTLVATLGLTGAWLAAGIDWLAQAVTAIVLMASGRWRRSTGLRYAASRGAALSHPS
jgi:putative MATE family efflux protein